MANQTKIEWTDVTWNPLRGCSRISAGCQNCYAERIATRFSGPGMPFEGLVERTPAGVRWNGKIKPVPEALSKPETWKRPRKVFVNSMSDLFHENAPTEYIFQIFDVMMRVDRHIYQVLTKRPDRMNTVVAEYLRRKALHSLPEHIWIGVSVEDQDTANLRIPVLLQTPARIRFLSCEPLLGPLDLEPYLEQKDPKTGKPYVSWIIVGGETGPGARPMRPEWVYGLILQARMYDVPFFFKQWGSAQVQNPHTFEMEKATKWNRDWQRLFQGHPYEEFPEVS